MARRPPPQPKRPPVAPRGLAELTIRPPTPVGGPGPPPEGFRALKLGGPAGSVDEWYVYWGLAKVLRDPLDPRKPPFSGGRDWAYQVPVLLRNQLIPREAGSDVLDFVVYRGSAKIGIRVQSDLHVFGTFGGPTQIARDRFSKAHLEGYHMIDIFSQHFLDDPTGQKVCKVMRDAINLKEWPSPILFGRAEHARPKGLIR